MALEIAFLNPSHGPVGTEVRIEATGLDYDFGNAAQQVTFDGIPANDVTFINFRRIRADVPAGVRVDRFVEVAVLKVSTGEIATALFFAHADDLSGATLPFKKPGSQEVQDTQEPEIIQARDFANVHDALEIFLGDFLRAKGDLVAWAGSDLGLQRVPLGTAGQRFVSNAVGGEYLDRRVVTLQWAGRVDNEDQEGLLSGNALDTQAPPVGTALPVPRDGKLSIVSVYARADLFIGRINRIRVLVNGDAVFDTDEDVPAGQQPFFNAPQSYTFSPMVDVLADDLVEIGVTKSGNPADTPNVRAYAQVI